MPIDEVIELMRSRGFTCFIDVRTGWVLQADGAFFRTDGWAAPNMA